MQSDRSDRGFLPAPYVGADLTDRYSKGCKAIDVCGLTPVGDGVLTARFWNWKWDPPDTPLDVRPILTDLGEMAMIDGPQGLAAVGQTMRECERRVGAAGKTPCDYAMLAGGKPFSGFVKSGLDLFAALHGAKTAIVSSNTPGGRVGEVYPGDLWPLLARPALPPGKALPGKNRPEGKVIRRRLLEAVGIRFDPQDDLRNHDKLDACIGALVAAALRGGLQGIRAVPVPTPFFHDGNCLREGEMYRIAVEGADAQDAIKSTLADAELIDVGKRKASRPKVTAPATHKVFPHQKAKEITAQKANEARSHVNKHGGRTDESRAAALLDWLIEAAEENSNDPVVVTYGAGWNLVFGKPAQKGQREWGNLTKLAAATGPLELHGLGPVKLDTFLITEKPPRIPGSGHWEVAQYDEEDWLRVLSSATMISAKDLRPVN